MTRSDRKGSGAAGRAAAWLALCLAALVVPMAPARAAAPLSTYAIVAHDPANDATVLLVRAILAGAGAACPAFTIDGVAIAARTRPDPDPARFPVTVCEAVAPLDAVVAVDGVAVPSLAGYGGGALHVAVFGDTGCKSAGQDCAAGWPFPALAAAAAARKPDLVIHIGDYDYRGTPSRRAKGEPRVYDGCLPGKGKPYVSLADLSDWTTWNEDVFTPAAPLLSVAPWVVVRGNHELCSRGGRGWFYFLDPHSVLLDPLHGEPRCDAPVVTTAPYRVTVGGLDLVVADNSDGCDSRAWQSKAAFDRQSRALAPLMRQAAALAQASPRPVWLLIHRPLWSADVLPSDASFDGSAGWQQVLDDALGGTLPPQVVMELSGHVHEMQALSFDGRRAPQLIVGNGGTQLDPNKVALPVSGTLDGLATTGWVAAPPRTGDSFGFLDAEVTDAGHWTATATAYTSGGDAGPSPLLTCAMPTHDGELCAPPAP